MVELSVFKSANRNYLIVGMSNIINYSVIIKNIGDATASNVKLRDIINEEVTFIEGTFKVNGCELKVNNINNYINIGEINSGANTIITFSMKVSKYFKGNEIINKAIVSYCDDKGNSKNVESKEVIIPVINIIVCAQKQADRCSACIGDYISYTITIRNSGNIDINNVIFYDKLSENVELLPASVSINVDLENLEDINGGVNLGTIEPKSSVIIQFQVRVISMPSVGYIDNVGKFEFSYTINSNGTAITSIGESFTNIVKIKIINKAITC